MLREMDDFDALYALLEEAFPNSELRTYEAIKKLYKGKDIIIYGYYVDRVLLGGMMVWPLGSLIFLENFAVSTHARGTGVGSQMLKELCERYPNKEIVLEVEEPYDTLSKKRIAFYERNEFILSAYGYQQPQINIEINEIPLLLMGYRFMIDEAKFREIKELLFTKVYGV